MAQVTGAPCWMDLLTSDTERAREFYGGLFGWTAGEAAGDFEGYFMFLRDGVPVAGAMPKVAGRPGAELADQWSVYLSSPDARATARAAQARGGQLQMGPADVADLGTEAILTDPCGARVGVWQARSFPGFTVPGGTGGLAYCELLTPGYAVAVSFYQDVFGWQPQVASDTDDFRLTVLGSGEAVTAGIMDASAGPAHGASPQWMIYVRVDDADAALAQVSELGGTVTATAMDTPYGRLAGAADPSGAAFKIIG